MAEVMTHSLCGERFRSVDAFNRHVGNAGHPSYHNRQPLCGVLTALFEAGGRDYPRPPMRARQPRTGAGSEAGKYDAASHRGGRPKKHRSKAAAQAAASRAYRRRRAGA